MFGHFLDEDQASLFEDTQERYHNKQETHTTSTAEILTGRLKQTLIDLTLEIFGNGQSHFLLACKNA